MWEKSLVPYDELADIIKSLESGLIYCLSVAAYLVCMSIDATPPANYDADKYLVIPNLKGVRYGFLLSGDWDILIFYTEHSIRCPYSNCGKAAFVFTLPNTILLTETYFRELSLRSSSFECALASALRNLGLRFRVFDLSEKPMDFPEGKMSHFQGTEER